MSTFTKIYDEMKAERELAGFVLPYSAGIFLAAGIGFTGIISGSAFSLAAFTATAVILMIMVHPVRRGFSDVSLWTLLIFLGLAAGAWSGFTSNILEVSSAESAISLWASGFGHRMGEAIDAIPFEDPATNAMIKALTTGERNDIPKSVTDAFRDSGASHILSLSGFHLGIIYGIIRCSLSIFGNRRKAAQTRSFIIIAACGFYTLATGAGPSIVRSFLFILLGESARMLHRRQTTATLLMSSLLIQLVISPSSIRSVSFQLSYAAMAGIAYIYPVLRDFWPGKPSDDRPFTRAVRWIWNSASMSIACQLTTGPLAYLYFDSFPQHFLLTNLIALPLTSLIIPLGLAVLALHSLGICPSIMLKAAEALVQALSAALEIIAGM